ncbi:MAG TPA: hypothetical protein VFB79_18380 [Candidatus Angelobacter sp.]|nr:hypothetical protein [Candidatus Angelobacter sp.]
MVELGELPLGVGGLDMPGLGATVPVLPVPVVLPLPGVQGFATVEVVPLGCEALALAVPVVLPLLLAGVHGPETVFVVVPFGEVAVPVTEPALPTLDPGVVEVDPVEG